MIEHVIKYLKMIPIIVFTYVAQEPLLKDVRSRSDRYSYFTTELNHLLITPSIMRVLLPLQVLVLLVFISTAHGSQSNGELLQIAKSVQDVIQDIVNLNVDLAKKTLAQKTVFFKQFSNLITAVTVSGPIPEAYGIVNFWMANLQQYSKTLFTQSETSYTSKLQSLRLNLQEITLCPLSDVDEMISIYGQSIVTDWTYVFDESTQRLNDILGNSSALAIQLHNSAVNDKSSNVVLLEGRLQDNLNQTISELDAEFNSSYHLFIELTLGDLNHLWTWARSRIVKEFYYGT